MDRRDADARVTAVQSQQALVPRILGARGSRVAVGHDDSAAAAGEAACAVLAGVAGWWERAARAAGLSGRWLAPESAIDGLAHAPAVLVPADLRSLTSYAVGERYVGALARGVRARHGRHYTPATLAERLWAMARRSAGLSRRDCALPGVVRDPACGAGALLLPALREHLRASVDADPRMTIAGLPRLIEGVDADPSAVWIANVLLAAELLPVLAAVPARRRQPLPMLARAGDGLAQPGPARIVLMNPPYGRVRLDERERDRWRDYLYGHANLYALFLAAGLEALDRDGVLAALVPTSFLAGLYFAALRRELGRRASLRDLTFVEERGGVFAGVLQETCLAVFTRRKGRQTMVASVNGTVAEVAKVRSPRGERPWVFPRRSDDAVLATAAARMPLTLAGAGWRVSTGPLVWNRRRADLIPHPGAGGPEAAIVWAADLDGGVLHRDPARDELRWLRLGDEDAASMLLSEPAILVQRTTAPEQPRRVVCVDFNEVSLEAWGGRVVVENHVNVIRASTSSSLLSRSTLAAVLATRTIDRLVRCISGSVAVSAYELESIALPKAETLTSWETLRGEELEHAVAAAYRTQRQ